MLIDWLTIVVPPEALGLRLWEEIHDSSDRICRYDPRTKETRWEASCWDSVRSDSHQVAIRVGADGLYVQGSPARVLDGDQVFGGSAALDIRTGVRRMIEVGVRGAIDLHAFVLPSIPYGVRVTRVDVTAHYDAGSLENVREVLDKLRGVQGGRYRVSQQAGDTVYWSHRSRLRAGKAYAKGPHLRYEAKKHPGLYTKEEHELADRLLRLELRLGAQYWRERAHKPWIDWTPDDFREAWSAYFDRMMSDIDMRQHTDTELRKRVIAAAPTPGQGTAAWGTWCMIRALGWQATRDNLNINTWYRHQRILKAAGFSDTDLSHGQAGSIVAAPVVLARVDSWDQLRAA